MKIEVIDKSNIWKVGDVIKRGDGSIVMIGRTPFSTYFLYDLCTGESTHTFSSLSELVDVLISDKDIKIGDTLNIY